MKKLTRVICVVAFCLVAMFGMSNVGSAEEVQYTDNVIPAMTSNVSEVGEASVSSYFNQSPWIYPAYKAFNHSILDTESWVSEKGMTTGWLSYEFYDAKCITKYAIVARSPLEHSNELPKDWTFEGWNNELNSWVILDTKKDMTNWVAGEKKEFVIVNSNKYNKYRINITANCGYTDFIAIGELQMMETKPSSDYEGNSAILEVTMTNGTIKEYSLTNIELEGFLTWYDNRSGGTGKSYYRIPQKSNVKPFLSRKEYLSFDKIYSFEVKDYNE
ncbi:MAG: hypothetical protein ACERKN_21175 [Velocimicrobium sp.]